MAGPVQPKSLVHLYGGDPLVILEFLVFGRLAFCRLSAACADEAKPTTKKAVRNETSCCQPDFRKLSSCKIDTSRVHKITLALLLTRCEARSRLQLTEKEEIASWRDPLLPLFDLLFT